MLNAFIDPTKYGGYFAFLLACVIVMFDKLEQLHTLPHVLLLLGIAVSSAMIYNDNAGLTLLVVALYMQAFSVYIQKNKVSNSNP